MISVALFFQKQLSWTRCFFFSSHFHSRAKKKKNSTPTTALSPSSLFFLLLSRAPSLDLPVLRFALIIPERLRKKISVS